MDNKCKYCIGCDHFAFAGFDNQYCYLGYNVQCCPIAKHNKQIAEYKQAKEALRKEVEKPFLKVLDWIAKKLIQFQRWLNNV